MKYAVIGAGITGLNAAYQLLQKGNEVILFDGSGDGGLVQTRVVDGCTLELGAFTLVETPEVRTLLKELNLSDKITYPIFNPYKQYVWYNGHPVQAPQSFVSFVRSELFPLSDKIRILRQVFFPLKEKVQEPELSVAEVFSEHFTPSFVQNMVAPVLRGIFGGDCFSLSFSSVFSKLSSHLYGGGTFFSYMRSRAALGKRKIFHLRGGNAQLIQNLRAKVSSCVISEYVTLLQRKEDEYIVTTDKGNHFKADGVYLATAGKASAQYLASISADICEQLKQLRYAPIIVLHFAVPKTQKLLDKGFGILFPESADTKIIGVLFNSQLFPDVGASDSQVITICLGGVTSRNEVFMNKDDSFLVEYSKGELRKFLGISDAKSLLVTRWENAIPQYEAAHPQLLKTFLQVESRYPNLFFCGADKGGVGVPDRIAAIHVETK